MMDPHEWTPSPRDLAEARRLALVRIVDDDASMRDALECVLSIEGWATMSYASAEAFLTEDAPSDPGVVLMDIRMPGMSGLSALTEMASRGNTLPVVFLTGHGDVDMAVWALKHEAFDFIEKPVDNERLLRAIAVAACRSVYKAGGRLLPSDAEERWGTLTERECDVVRHLARGLVNRQVAEVLDIAARTVEVHRQNAFKKLGVKTPAEAALVMKTIEGK